MARPGLTRHPKFRRLQHELKIGRALAWGTLECIWEPAYESGNPVIGEEVDVELAAEWQGPSGELCKALVKCGFLDAIEDGKFAIHDLHANAPEYVRLRWQKEQNRAQDKVCTVCGESFRSGEPHAKYCSQACRQKNYEQKKAKTDADSQKTDAHLTQTDGLADAHLTVSDAAPAPAPAPAPISNKRMSTSSSTTTASTAVDVDTSPVVLSFPVVKGKTNGSTDWALRQSVVNELRECFPALDVVAEARKALAWVRANEANRKTASGMRRFLTAWITRAQNSGRAVRSSNGHHHRATTYGGALPAGREDL